MKIQVEVEIFDDPEYCTKSAYDAHHQVGKERRCPYFYGSECEQFRDNEGSMIALETRQLRPIKCPQCKKAWQRAQNEKLNVRISTI